MQRNMIRMWWPNQQRFWQNTDSLIFVSQNLNEEMDLRLKLWIWGRSCRNVTETTELRQKPWNRDRSYETVAKATELRHKIFKWGRSYRTEAEATELRHKLLNWGRSYATEVKAIELQQNPRRINELTFYSTAGEQCDNTAYLSQWQISIWYLQDDLFCLQIYKLQQSVKKSNQTHHHS